MTRRLRRSLLVLVLAATALALTATASAAPDDDAAGGGLTSPSLAALIGVDDVFAAADLRTALNPNGNTPTARYGPYASGSPDTGSCGNRWAEDVFDREFTVRSNKDGTFSVVEQFKNGWLATVVGPSPGACETGYTSHGTVIVPGAVGEMTGYFVISGAGAPTSTSPYCDATDPANPVCTTAIFVNTHFAPCYPFTCGVTTYYFHYAVGQPTPIYHEWRNASADRGGDGGDIATG
jgi:hypothetical protein